MSFKKLAIDSFYVTVMLLGLMWSLSKIPVQNFDVLNPLDQAFSDFELTDIVFSHLREQPTVKDTNVVIVNIGDLDRYGIAQIVDSLNQFDPMVIALDVGFYRDKDPYKDSVLSSAFSRVKHLVLGFELVENPITHRFDSIRLPIPAFRQYANLASVNVISEGKGKYRTERGFSPQEHFFMRLSTKEIGSFDTSYASDTTIRERIGYNYFSQQTYKANTKVHYTIHQHVLKDTVLPTFPTVIASLANPKKAQILLKRNNETETINFRGNINANTDEELTQNSKILCYGLDWNQVIGEERGYDPSMIKGKIVIMGYLGSYLGDNKWEDKFHTPLNPIYIGKTVPDMYGVVVHANKVSMILDEDYVNTFPDWLTYLINLIFIYINIIIYSWMFLRLEMWWDGASLVATLIQVSLIIVLLLAVFNKYSYKLDFTLLIVALFLCGNFIEFYFGLIKPGLLRLKTQFPGLKAKINVKQENID